MYKKLVRYIDDWHFSEVDPIALKRRAEALLEQIEQKVDPICDRFEFYRITVPFLQSAIRGEVTESLDEEITEIVSKNYYHEREEGDLASRYDQDFDKAVDEFVATVEALPIEEFEEVQKDGAIFAWVDFEEEGDWPDHVKKID